MKKQEYKYNEYKETNPKESKEAKFKGKNYEYSEVLVKIRKNKKSFIKNIIPLIILVAFLIGVFMIRRSIYYKEYNDNNWYVGIGYLESSHEYTEEETDSNGNTITTTKYKRYYTYKGKDGKEYIYQKRGYSTKGAIGEEIKIYINEEDNSENLEIKNFKTEDFALKLTAFIILGPIIVIYLIVFIILYTKKYAINKKLKKLEKEL